MRVQASYRVQPSRELTSDCLQLPDCCGWDGELILTHFTRSQNHIQHCPLHISSSPGPADANDAEELLERLGYKVFLGGVYSVEDYRAM